jgi:hypothetical protein
MYVIRTREIPLIPLADYPIGITPGSLKAAVVRVSELAEPVRNWLQSYQIPEGRL